MAADPRRVKELFVAALDLPDPQARQAFLDRECGADAELRQRLDVLLKAHDEPALALNQPLAALAPVGPEQTGPYVGARPDEQVGTVIVGRYKLLEQIGEGGMGTVWVAEQTQPVRRKVALKLIKAGMDSKSVLSRFEAERQALALMDHPNIAKVLDGGSTDSGRPFFVMEYVKGVPLTKYCDDARLGIAQRLALFVPVCQAVQHAHQKGIIHRDLKPGNILVCLYDGQPVPKVIDFGLAKAMHQPLTEQTLHTAHGEMMGTPLYMSPEQAEFNNLDVDTRTDIYALGVILYELLTGTTPLERQRFKEAAWQEIIRLIKEEEPPRPSARLSGSGSLPSVAAQRGLEPVKLTRLVRGELDWIVMKCLEKDRARRYETANGLARELQRYLADEVVEARPPSAGYRFRKFVRRNKGRVAATAALALVVIIGVGAVVAVQAKANRDLGAANQRLEQANERERQRFGLAMEAVGLFHGEVSKDLLLKEKQFDGLRNKLLRAAATFYEKLEGQLKDQDDPASRATLGKAYHELGVLTNQIGDRRAALAVHRKALAVRRELAARPDAGPETVLDVARTLFEVGRTLPWLGDRESGVATLEETLAAAEQVESRFGPSESSRSVRASAYASLGYHVGNMNRIDDALAAYERARELRQALFDTYPLDRANQRDLAYIHNQLAIGLINSGKMAEGLAERQKAQAHLRAAAADPSDLEGQYNLALSDGDFGITYSRVGLLVEALESLESALTIYQRLLEANPASTKFQEDLSLYGANIGQVLLKMGRLVEARAALERSREMHRRLVEANPAVTRYRSILAEIHIRLGDIDRATGRLDEAREEYGRALAMSEELMKSNPNDREGVLAMANSLRKIGLLEYAAGRFAESAAANRRAIVLYEGVPNLWNLRIFELACCQALQAGMAGKDGSGIPADAGPAEAAKAMEVLRKAVAAGYRHLHDLRTDAGLDPLRQRNDFRQLLAKLEEKAKTHAKASPTGKVK
jgi:tetratricopeptide (TPR) repeat protein